MLLLVCILLCHQHYHSLYLHLHHLCSSSISCALRREMTSNLYIKLEHDSYVGVFLNITQKLILTLASCTSCCSDILLNPAFLQLFVIVF
jgi:hypothetical protein